MLVGDGAGSDWLRCGDNSGVNQLCAAAYLALFAYVITIINAFGWNARLCAESLQARGGRRRAEEEEEDLLWSSHNTKREKGIKIEVGLEEKVKVKSVPKSARKTEKLKNGTAAD